MGKIRLRKKRNTWFARVVIDGKRVERSTGCTDEAEAKSVAEGWEAEAADPDYATKTTTLNDILGLLIEERQSRVRNGQGSQVTADYHEEKAGHLVRLLGHNFIMADISSARIWRYIDERRGEGAKDTAIAKEVRATLQAGLRLAKSRGLWNGDISIVIPDDFKPKYKPKDSKPDQTRGRESHPAPGSGQGCRRVLLAGDDGRAVCLEER